MSDLPVGQFLVSPNAEIERKWTEVAIQEKRSRIARWKQDIEDLTKGKILDLECRIAMCEKEIGFLKEKRDAVIIKEVDNG